MPLFFSVVFMIVAKNEIGIDVYVVALMEMYIALPDCLQESKICVFDRIRIYHLTLTMQVDNEMAHGARRREMCKRILHVLHSRK